MDLKSYLARYPEVQIAGARDDERIKKFFHELPMKGEGLQLLYQRLPTFHAFLAAHSERHWVFFVQNDRGEVEGAGTLVIRHGMLNGKPAQVGYLGDLRIDNIRRWGRYWRDFYLSLMREAHKIDEFRGVAHFLTAIMRQNKRAQKALGQSALGYHSYHDYQMINVLGRWRPSRAPYEATTWAQLPIATVWEFHRSCNEHKPFGWRFDDVHHEGQWRLKHWPDFSTQQGVALQDSKGIVLSGAFWSPTRVKKIILERIPGKEAVGLSVLRPFFALPREGEELRCLYLTMLDGRPGLADEEYQAAMEQVIGIGLKKARQLGFHCLSIAQFSERPLKRALAPYIAFRTDLELFIVNPDRNPVPGLAREVPGFEMGLV